MNYINILFLICIGLGILALVIFLKHRNWLKTNTRRSYQMGDYEVLLWSLTTILIIFVIITSIVSVVWYNKAISLPYEYEAACDTVSETKDLLMRYENLDGGIGNIGQGLEALELKQKLEIAIREKNNLYADIQGWLNNPLMPYRDLLRNNLEKVCV